MGLCGAADGGRDDGGVGVGSRGLDRGVGSLGAVLTDGVVDLGGGGISAWDTFRYFEHFLRIWCCSLLFLGTPCVGLIFRPQNSHSPGIKKIKGRDIPTH